MSARPLFTVGALVLVTLCATLSCFHPTLHVYGRGPETGAGGAKGFFHAHGDYLYIYLFADKGGSLFLRDTESRTVVLLRIRDNGTTAVCPGQLDGFVFRHALHLSFAAEVVSGKVTCSHRGENVTVSGELVVHELVRPLDPTEREGQPATVSVNWDGVTVRPDSSLPQMLFSPRFVRAAPRLEEWRQSLEDGS